MWKKSLFLFLTIAFVLASCSPKNKGADDDNDDNNQWQEIRPVSEEGFDWLGGELSLSNNPVNQGFILSAHWNGEKLSTMDAEYFDNLLNDEDFENTLIAIDTKGLKTSVKPEGKVYVTGNMHEEQEGWDLRVTTITGAAKKGDSVTVSITFDDASGQSVTREVVVNIVE
ncbi:hypothetical protein [Entomospira culicis]|uniref:Uncharacterized protein n=1 Tax=Entomospira culicis TaxID=2719989 RepID=A0A968GGA3_9SPIO|nr:hypothetical protein [Entomospira culicis]NIZ19333.1 hypothetical protein [Entomospira culicis]NIZ69762.1 hypothetical protein [Entomospira culicis]WDI36873.1 hypothetical protein PVA46_05980 [Entomospira culicis]WDI38502.1 hypothetical protein PVA47_05990 [Entomospira culicis]